jgi:hypothetical protein
MKVQKTLKIGLLLLCMTAAFCSQAFAQQIQIQGSSSLVMGLTRFKPETPGDHYIYSISDSTPVVQLGLGIRLLYKSGFFARLDANYNRFKTEFSLDGYTPQYLLLAGFIYNEKMIIRLLAGQNWQLFNRKGWSFDLYGYAGPSLAFEMGKNFSRTNYLERGGVLGTSAAALKVQPTPGFSFGLGTSIQWHEKVSLFLEISGNRPMYQVENVLTPEIAYRQFYLTLGLGYRIFRRATY